MKLSVLALDCDGTIARDGRLAPEVRAAIGAARSSGITVALVTGRILDELRCAAGDLHFVDVVGRGERRGRALPGQRLHRGAGSRGAGGAARRANRQADALFARERALSMPPPATACA